MEIKIGFLVNNLVLICLLNLFNCKKHGLINFHLLNPFSSTKHHVYFLLPLVSLWTYPISKGISFNVLGGILDIVLGDKSSSSSPNSYTSGPLSKVKLCLI